MIKTSWDLSPLFKNDSDPKIHKLRKMVVGQTASFVKRWRNREDYLSNPKTLKAALSDYESWNKNFGTYASESYYYHLRESLDESSSQIKAKVNIVNDLSTKIQNDIQFFEIKLSKIDVSTQKRFLNDPQLKDYRHFLEKLFLSAKYILSEPEEKIMNLKSITSYDNWVRMTSSLLGKEERKSMGENGKVKMKNFSELTGLMNSKNKKVRDMAANNFNDILARHIDVAENELNSVLQHKKINDGIRGYERADKARHISDDLESEVVDTLVRTVSGHFDISKRFYTLKAKVLGVKKLEYHERNVEIGSIDKKYKFEDGCDIIGNTFNKLDRQFFTIFDGFVKNGQVDVFPQKGKKSGAFCTYGLLSNPTYILLNWNNKLNDVLTFAHELGHGINNELIKLKQNSLSFGTPTSTAEVASTFMEDFVLQKLLNEADDKTKLTIYMMKLNEEVSTIFRQIAFYRFETELHKIFREKGYLGKNDIGNIFQKHMISYMGGAVEQSEGSQNWWVYVSHFRYYFYVYSYASGLLISKALQAKVKENPDSITQVKEFLSAGLSDSPKEIFARLGIDITNPKFWIKGIREVENTLKQTEELSAKIKL